MLIRHADLAIGRRDLRIAGGRVAQIAPHLPPRPDEQVIDALGNAVIPGLHDHHIHLYSLAAAMESLDCGPPLDAGRLAAALRGAAANAVGWIRGVGYHESVAGDIDRDWLDAHVPDAPVRIQHRSGRLWMFNSCALDLLTRGGGAAHPIETVDGRMTGRLFDGDAWLRARRASQRPDLRTVSALLARYGIVGVTDAGHGNGHGDFIAMQEAQRCGALTQAVHMLGNHELDAVDGGTSLRAGCFKIHLHDHDLPSPETLRATVERAHDAGRGVAVHCVTNADLIVALSAIEAAGPNGLDRIEHAAMVPPDVVDWIAALGLAVVTQPHFIAERGDSYRQTIADQQWPWMYRVNTLLKAGIAVAGGSDAAYGRPDPWASMHAAVHRRTSSGAVIGEGERIDPDTALALFTSPAESPGRAHHRLAAGDIADLCLLDRPRLSAMAGLGEVRVLMTLRSGSPIWLDDRVAPMPGRSTAEPLFSKHMQIEEGFR